MLLTAINAASRKVAIKSVRFDIVKARQSFPIVQQLGRIPTQKELEAILDGILAQHQPIFGYLCSGYGVHLQYQDSLIAEKTMLDLGREGIAVLPVHDSFVCILTDGRRLVRAMTEAFKTFTNDYMPGIDMKACLEDGFIDVYMDDAGNTDWFYRIA